MVSGTFWITTLILPLFCHFICFPQGHFSAPNLIPDIYKMKEKVWKEDTLFFFFFNFFSFRVNKMVQIRKINLLQTQTTFFPFEVTLLLVKYQTDYINFFLTAP